MKGIQNIREVTDTILNVCERNDFNFQKSVFEKEIIGDTELGSLIRTDFFHSIITDNDFSLVIDDFTKHIITKFLIALSTYGFANENEIIDFFNHDIFIEKFPENFNRWIIENPERVKYIKRACEEYSISMEESEQLIRTSYDVEVVDVCANIFDRIKDILIYLDK
jgi:hypothetical protein